MYSQLFSTLRRFAFAAFAFVLIPGAQAQEAAPSSTAETAPAFEAADLQTFDPAVVFTGSDLAGMDPLSGSWEANRGEYVGTVGEAGTALLIPEGEYQDFRLGTEFRCDRPCLPGVLIRGEASGGRTTGVLYTLGEEDAQAYELILEENGREIKRRPLEPSPSPYPQSMMTFRAEYPGLGMLYPAELGGRRTSKETDVDGTWNHAEIWMIGNSIHGRLNGPGTPEANVVDVAHHGHIGLYVSGEPGTTVRFRNVGLKPMDNRNALPEEKTSPRFERMQLDAMFYSEAITAADVDQDGNMDVISGPNIFMGPDFTSRREIFVPEMYEATSYPDPLLSSAGDVTGDGYPDVLHTGEPGRPGFLYVNPGEEVRRWDKYMVIPSVDNEVAFFDDIDGDAELEYVYTDGGFIGYAEPGDDPTTMWTFHKVTEQGPWGAMYAHGLGSGDIDGDGRKDIIQAYGWWKQPADPTDGPWTYHPEEFGRWGTQQGGPGGARTYAYDVNGDGLNDVVTSLEGHGFGLAWFEQRRDGEGGISFEQHTIMDDFAEPNDGVTFAALHALALADIDGDGLKDIVTGKRWWAHFGENPTDPDAFGDPVIYWFRLVRDGESVRFEPELINNHTGVGTDMTTADLNGDGLPDVMSATRYGTNIFLSKPASE